MSSTAGLAGPRSGKDEAVMMAQLCCSYDVFATFATALDHVQFDNTDCFLELSEIFVEICIPFRV